MRDFWTSSPGLLPKCRVRTSNNLVSLSFSCVPGTVADTCPVGTRGAVIQAGADEYSRVALRCNESFEFIRMVVRRLFFATKAMSPRVTRALSPRNAEIRLSAARIISSFTALGTWRKAGVLIEPIEREDSLEVLPRRKDKRKWITTLKQRMLNTNFSSGNGK